MISDKLNSATSGRIGVVQASQPARGGSIRAPRLPLSGQRCPANPQAGKPALRAFSLIEILIAVTLMSVIVLGLMAMFGETQRAFRTGISQVDALEGGRSALEMMAREVEQARASGVTNYGNFFVGQNPNLNPPFLVMQALPGSAQPRENVLQEIMFMTREGQRWSGIGYSVYYTNWVGSLYRYETNSSQLDIGYSPPLLNGVLSARPSKVIDNVVNLRVNVFDSLGRQITRTYNTDYPNAALDYLLVDPNLPVRIGNVVNCGFYGDALPAYVEIELGILDAKTADRARAIGEDSPSQQQVFLEKQAGKVRVFRQRIPIRNVDPSVYQ